MLRELDAAAVDAGGCATERVNAEPVAVGSTRAAATSSTPTTKPADEVVLQTESPSVAPKHTVRIGLMLYYTDAAIALFPNTDPGNPPLAQLQATATGLIDQLNQALVNSGDPYYVVFEQVGSLVHLPGYNESPQINDPNLRFANGHLFTLRDYERNGGAPRRETLGADFAVLLVADQGNPNANPPAPVWGAAYTQRNNCIGDQQCDVGDGVFPVPNFGYRNYAFSAVSIAPQAQNLTFAHEVGHMLGSNHDPNAQFPLAGLRGAFSISYGYRLPAVARDIMADPRCIDTNADSVPDQCTDRQPQFANPRAVFIGTQVASGTAALSDVSRTISCLAEPSGNLYPLGESQSAPNIFWSGFEAPGLAVSTCPIRVIW